MAKFTFQQFQAEYPDDAACLAKLMEINFGGTDIHCPSCGVRSRLHMMNKRRGFACQECGHHVYPCADTIFHKSSTKLTIWFFAMYLMTSTRHGVAAKEIQRQTGVTYKTAWRICHELRKLMASADYTGPMRGHVEVDETHVGGVQSNKDRKARGSNKTIVMGIVERDAPGFVGTLRAGPVPNDSASSLEPVVAENVEPGSFVSTDEHKAYKGLASLGYRHATVTHSAGEYVKGETHTNTLEGHWSLLNRSIRGTHVHVSAKHLWKYVAEFSYRRNFRHSHEAMFNRLVVSFSQPRLVET
jgi:transposase